MVGTPGFLREREKWVKKVNHNLFLLLHSHVSFSTISKQKDTFFSSNLLQKIDYHKYFILFSDKAELNETWQQVHGNP